MKNILIATDFSKEAYCALYYATQLFKEEDATFHIANFYGDEIHTSVYSIVNEEEFKKAPLLKISSQVGCTETLHKIIRDSELGQERFEIISSEQKLIKGIENLIKERDIDLVIMGTKKHRGTLQSIYGTHTTKLIERAISRPILVIPRELDYTPPVNIAFASDLSRKFEESSFSFLRQLAKSLGSRITVVYDGEEGSLSKEQWKNFNELKSYFEEVPVHLEYSFTHIEISRTLAEFVKNNNMDLLSMIYYKHGFTESIFREPVVENIDRHLSFPFLILPEKS
ncbi:universal stress protein [Gramella jeungdoensis]|uniref:Universal stress protein n=1 Tax=Gramella jeungdoensis TaxID=708091 RepID=A0ABT0YZL8_9FLAO|nr:universal stress protein [Gramella jeungdoensis]MCM8568916.1 universal stress protein [Gramella jeungdoensis]